MLAAYAQAGDDVVSLTGLRRGHNLHTGCRRTLTDLDMVEIRFHRRAGCSSAVPVDGDHAQFGRQDRLRWHGAGRRIRLHCSHEDFRPFAELVGICRHSSDAHLDSRATIKATKAKLRLIGRAGGMPRRTILMQFPLDSIIADFDGGIIRGFGHGGPQCRGQAARVSVRANVGVGLHDETLRRFRHAMVMVGRGGGAALTACQCRATGNALYLLRLTHGSVIFDVVQGD
nr:hypothetical protein AUSP0071_00001 [uncultured phage]